MSAAPGYVFVSYAREDADAVHRLVQALERRGIPFRYDPDLTAGSQWEETLSEWMRGASAVLVAWSDSSASSTWVIREASEASDRLIPVTFTGMSAVPAPFQNLYTVDLSGWTGDPGDKRLVSRSGDA